MRLFEIKSYSDSFAWLFESKTEFVIKTYGEKLVQAAKRENPPISDVNQIVAKLTAMDPTNGKYLVFLAKIFSQQSFRLEDAPRVRTALMNFDKFKAKLPNKDIMQYAKLSDVEDAVEPLMQDPNAAVSNRQQKMATKLEGAEYVINTPNFKVIHPKTEEAACLYGANTKWCTAAREDNKFSYYDSQGPIYIIMTGDRKFQYHYESDQFMDEKDNDLTKKDIDFLSGFPQYKDFLNQQIKIHYGV